MVSTVGNSKIALSYITCYCQNLILYIAVDLQQTSPTHAVCPRDDVSFTCTVTVSGNESLFLLWLNPDNEHDRKLYLVNESFIHEDVVVGAFTTEIVQGGSDTIISTATINELNLVDIMSAGISCFDGVGNNQTLYVAESGRKIIAIHFIKFFMGQD